MKEVDVSQLNEVPLVVGAGPAGLTTAIELGRHGIECTVVERRHEPSRHPRATVISTRTMEILRSWGLEKRVLAGAVEVDWLMWDCETLTRVDEGTPVEVGLPTRSQAAVLSPSAPACISQYHLERVLLEHARELGSVSVEIGTAVVALEGDPDRARATLRDRAGRERVVTAPYIVGADGARSTVREALAIPMRGPDHLLVAVTALIDAPLWELVGDHRYGFYATSRAGEESSFFPTGPDDHWLFGYLLDPGGRALALPSQLELIERIRRAAGVSDLPVLIERVGSFSAAAQIAECFRSGCAFLVGDAAHRVTPRGGTGMNTAIHDGYDLGWKLAWVLRGWARPDLLETYEGERRPVAEHNVARSADPGGSRRPAGEELRVDLGGRIAHHWLPGQDGRRSTLDLLGPGLTLLTDEGVEARRAAVKTIPESPPITVATLDKITARALGIRPGGALLVRPDGTPAGSCLSGIRAGALDRAVAALTHSGQGVRDQSRVV